MKDFETVDLKKSRVKFNISMGLLGMFGYSLVFIIQMYSLMGKTNPSFLVMMIMSVNVVFFVVSVKIFSKNVDRITSGKYK